MVKDIICAEAELSIAANNLVEYADFLSRTMESYVAVLAEIQERGIQNDLVCSKLSSIAQYLNPYKTRIKDECDRVAGDVSDYFASVAEVDNFKFPTDITSIVAPLVDQFF